MRDRGGEKEINSSPMQHIYKIGFMVVLYFYYIFVISFACVVVSLFWIGKKDYVYTQKVREGRS